MLKPSRNVHFGGEDEYLYGINPVFEVIRAGRRAIRHILVAKGKSRDKRIDEILAAAASGEIPVDWTERSKLARLFPHREDQGVAALVSPFRYVQPEELLVCAPSPRLLVALDQIQDPRNLGAIIRSAVAFGCGGVIIHKNRSARITPLAVKASSGMTEHIDVAMATNLSYVMREARRLGMRVVGLDAGSPKSLYSEDLSGDVMLVLGSEGKGMRKLITSLCDELVSIPISPLCESLNVSAAAAVVMAEVARVRGSFSRHLGSP